MSIGIKNIIVPTSSGGEPQVDEEYLDYLYEKYNVSCYPINKIFIKDTISDFNLYRLENGLYVDKNTKYFRLIFDVANASDFTISITKADDKLDWTEWFNCEVLQHYVDDGELLISIQRNTNMSELEDFDIQGEFIDVHIDYSEPIVE